MERSGPLILGDLFHHRHLSIRPSLGELKAALLAKAKDLNIPKARLRDALASLDELVDGDDDSSDMPQVSAEEPSAVSDESEADEADALITETARILADAINLSGPVMARADSR